MANETLGKGEFAIIGVLARRPRGAHGTALLDDLATATGRRVSVGAMYTTLDRLETKGFVSSTWAEPTKERGGRRKKVFRVEAAGMRAFESTVRVMNAINAPFFGGRPVEA